MKSTNQEFQLLCGRSSGYSYHQLQTRHQWKWHTWGQLHSYQYLSSPAIFGKQSHELEPKQGPTDLEKNIKRKWNLYMRNFVLVLVLILSTLSKSFASVLLNTDISWINCSAVDYIIIINKRVLMQDNNYTSAISNKHSKP